MKKRTIIYLSIVALGAVLIYINFVDVPILFNWMGQNRVRADVIFVIPAWFSLVGFVFYTINRSIERNSPESLSRHSTVHMLNGLIHAFFIVALIQLFYSGYPNEIHEIAQNLLQSMQWGLPGLVVVYWLFRSVRDAWNSEN